MKPFCRLILPDETLCRLVEAALAWGEIPFGAGVNQAEEDAVGIFAMDSLPSEEELESFRCAVVIAPFGARASSTEEDADRLNRVFEDRFLMLPRPFLVTDLIRAVSHFSDSSEERGAFVAAAPVPAVALSGRVQLFPEERLISFGDRSVRFTALEWAVFSCLYEAGGSPVSRETMRNLFRSRSGSNAPDVYVRYLRKKLNPLFGDGVLLSVRGEGYRLRLPSGE